MATVIGRKSPPTLNNLGLIEHPGRGKICANGKSGEFNKIRAFTIYIRFNTFGIVLMVLLKKLPRTSLEQKNRPTHDSSCENDFVYR